MQVAKCDSPRNHNRKVWLDYWCSRHCLSRSILWLQVLACHRRQPRGQAAAPCCGRAPLPPFSCTANLICSCRTATAFGRCLSRRSLDHCHGAAQRLNGIAVSRTVVAYPLPRTVWPCDPTPGIACVLRSECNCSASSSARIPALILSWDAVACVGVECSILWGILVCAYSASPYMIWARLHGLIVVFAQDQHACQRGPSNPSLGVRCAQGEQLSRERTTPAAAALSNAKQQPRGH